MLSPEENQRQYRKWLYYRNPDDAFDEQGPSFRYRNMPDPPADWDPNSTERNDDELRRAAKFFLHLAQEGFTPQEIDNSLEEIVWELEWKLRNMRDTLDEEIQSFYEEPPTDYMSVVGRAAEVLTVQRELVEDLPDYGFWFAPDGKNNEGVPLAQAKKEMSRGLELGIQALQAINVHDQKSELLEVTASVISTLTGIREMIDFNLNKINPDSKDYGMGDFDEDFGFGL